MTKDDFSPAISRHLGYYLNPPIQQPVSTATCYYLTDGGPEQFYVYGTVCVGQDGNFGCRWDEGTYEYFEAMQYDLHELIEILLEKAK